MQNQESKRGGALKNCALQLVDTIYHASVYTIIAYTALMILLAIVATAVYFGVVEVPEFHPR